VAASERAEGKIATRTYFPLTFQTGLFHNAGQWESSDIAGVRSEGKTSSLSRVDRVVSEAKPPKLSTRICEAWQWRQANGALREMVCRGMLLMLERAG
jgi:hypothetical protein